MKKFGGKIEPSHSMDDFRITTISVSRSLPLYSFANNDEFNNTEWRAASVPGPKNKRFVIVDQKEHKALTVLG
jgi:hypothetical protein